MNYKVIIHEDKPFQKTIDLPEDITKTVTKPQTAEIIVLNDDGDIVQSVEYGYTTIEEIKKSIQSKEEIDLDGCYVSDLFVKNCNIKSISAQIAFFNNETSFFDIQFEGPSTFFSTIFNGKLSFNESTFNRETSFDDVTFTENSSFNGTTFYMDSSFDGSAFQGYASFDETLFSGDISFTESTFFRYASFDKSTFGGYTSFDESTFHGYASFDKSSFRGNASFLRSSFRGKATLNTTSFNGDVSFFGSMFCGNVTFFNSIFYGYTTFSESKFDDNVSFIKSNFIKDVSFKLCQFCKLSTFNEVFFYAAVFFIYSRFDGDSSFFCSSFNGVTAFSNSSFQGKSDFRGTRFNKRISFDLSRFQSDVDFSDATVKDIISFRKNIFPTYIYFDFVECDRLALIDCIFEKSCNFGTKLILSEFCIIGCKNLGQIFIDYDRNNLKNAIYKYAKNNGLSDYEIASEFNLLKVNFNNTGRYDDEDKAYVEYKRRIRRLMPQSQPANRGKVSLLAQTKRFILKIFRQTKAFFSWLLLDLISCYCTKPFRVLVSAFITIFLFGLFYYVTDTVEFSGNYQGIAGCLYHSVITFFTIGYGDSNPSETLGLLLTGMEGFSGVFLMSLFTVSFVRKVLR